MLPDPVDPLPLAVALAALLPYSLSKRQLKREQHSLLCENHSFLTLFLSMVKTKQKQATTKQINKKTCLVHTNMNTCQSRETWGGGDSNLGHVRYIQHKNIEFYYLY